MFNEIVSNNSGDGAFEIQSANDILNELRCSKLKAPSDDKTDIHVRIHDFLTGYTRRCGFSIKSQLGHASTLLNPSKATNFKYIISGMTDSMASRINQIEGKTKIIARMQAIEDSNACLKFCKAENEIFSGNMMLVDSKMEGIVGEILLKYYQTKIAKCKDILDIIEDINPLGFPRKGYYIFKFKKLLCSVALGMVPSHPWNGQDDANGGYIIVKQNGDVLAYHLYNRNRFEDYLLNNTRFETPSTNRYQFMTIYKENGCFYLDLNLQIRFINPPKY